MITYLRGLILQDFWLKLFSLVLAILIWFTVSFALRRDISLASLAGRQSEKPLTFSNIPVLVQAAAADLREFKVNPTEVTVTVRGPQRIIEKMKPDQVRAVVDLTGIESARGLHKRIEVSTPPDVTIIEISPVEVDVIVPPRK